MMKVFNLTEKTTFLGMMVLFLWISFFAPLASEQVQLRFVILLCVLLIARVCFKENIAEVIFNKEEISFWVFFLIMIGCVIGVKEPTVALRHFRLFILPVPFCYFFAKLAFNNKYGILIMRSVCIMASLVFIFGIIEFITKKNFLYSDFIYNFCYLAFKGRRMMSIHIHPAALGTYFTAILPLAIGLLFIEKKTVFKLAAAIYIIFISIGIILTFSRGALLGALAGCFVLMLSISRYKKKIVIFFSILLVLVLIIIASSLLYHCGYFPFHRFSLAGLSQQHSYLAKIFRFEMAIRLLKEHPFWGVGLGHYRVLFDYYIPPNLPLQLRFDYLGKVADCMFMTMLAETGMIGFGSFLFFIFYLFKKLKINLLLILKPKDRLMIICFFSGLIGILCTFFTYDGLYWSAPNLLFWCYAGILASLSLSHRTIE